MESVGVLLVGVVPGVLLAVSSVDPVGTGVASGAVDGGGVEAEEPDGSSEAVAVGETATRSGATAWPSWTGLAAEPTSTPNASSTITTTAAIDGEGSGSPA